jgi:uncharacterized protein DUF5666
MKMELININAGNFIKRRWMRMLLAALVLAGCGGGGGVDSGGTGSSFTSGPITGFGSVIVNRVHFDDTSASVMDLDGMTRSRDDLRLGMTTEIRGSVITADATGLDTSAASTIVFGGDIVGQIDSIDLAGNQLVVFGQTIDINATTVFDDATVSKGLPSLVPGDVIEVYALFDAATGHYSATRIERKGAVAAFRLRGVVSNLNTSAKTFDIGNQHISYAGLSGPSPAMLANGSSILVRVQPARVGGLWIVAALDDGVERPRDRDEVRIEGLIGVFTSAVQFSVNGVPVDASHISPPAGLASGVRVEVVGTFSGGALVADQIKIETPGDLKSEGFELRGLVTSVNIAQLSFVIRGETITYSLTTTDFRNGTAANLAQGVNVEARGELSPDGTQLLATRITFK